MADVGWEGKWEANIVGDGSLNELRDRSGEPVMMRSGKLNEWCLVNLRTGEIRYPARG